MSIHAEQRRAILQAEVARRAAMSQRVEFMGADVATLTIGHPVNHALHFLLMILTCGLWAVVWIIVGATSGERRVTVWVDDYGRVVESPA